MTALMYKRLGEIGACITRNLVVWKKLSSHIFIYTG